MNTFSVKACPTDIDGIQYNDIPCECEQPYQALSINIPQPVFDIMTPNVAFCSTLTDGLTLTRTMILTMTWLASFDRYHHYYNVPYISTRKSLIVQKHYPYTALPVNLPRQWLLQLAILEQADASWSRSPCCVTCDITNSPMFIVQRTHHSNSFHNLPSWNGLVCLGHVHHAM